MAITKLPAGQSFGVISCAICQVELSADKASAGLLDAKGHQAFACVSHFSEVELLIMGWADFIAEQRLVYLQRLGPDTLIYGEGNSLA